MGIWKRAASRIFYAAAVVLNAIFGGFIAILDTIVILTEWLRRSFLQLLLAGGCLLFFLLMNPIGLLILLRGEVLVFLLVIFGVPMLGRSFISLLQYGQYVSTEYLFDYADYLKKGKSRKFRSFGEYGAKYIRMEQEKQERAQRARREAEQRMWEERFRAWYEQSGGQTYYGTRDPYGRYAGQGQYRRPGGQQTQNPYEDFVARYQNATRILGVPLDTDEYQVKLQYRKLAKQLHPDVNPSADATKKFQELSDAYDFLSKENIERYKSMTKGRSQ